MTLLKMLVTDLEKQKILSSSKKGEGELWELSLLSGEDVLAKELSNGCFLKKNLCPIKGLENEELFSLLLEANFLGQGTGSSFIGLDETESHLFLSMYIPYPTTAPLFQDKLEEFFNYLSYWEEMLKSPTNTPSPLGMKK